MTSPDAHAFHTTRWTRVLAAREGPASPESQSALSELCEIYYAPVHAFIQHAVGNQHDTSADDLTQEFFAKFLAHPGMDAVDQKRGRFRSYLLGAVKHFLLDQTKHDRAQKRGGDSISQSLDDDSPSAPQPSVPPADDTLYDRAWAIALLDRALNTLAAEQETAGKSTHFETLKPWLNGDATSLSQSDAAQALDLSENAVKVAIHRLRKRFREIVTTEIAQTVETESEIQQELNHLIQSLN
ncbi:MAG: sigma-70 family RNA polymerase sigma factor [Verrucomicrobiota bacterium]